MGIDLENLPFENGAVYRLIKEKTNGNVSLFANSIGISQQRINRLFSIDQRSGRYPKVSKGIFDAITETLSISQPELLRLYGRKKIYTDIVDPMATTKEWKGRDSSIEERRVGEVEERGTGNTEERKVVYSHPDIIDYKGGKPFYDVPFKMGYELPFNDNTSTPLCIIDFKPYNNCDFWCRATGDSMQPTINDGDLIAVKEVKDFCTMIVNRDIYAIVLKNELRAVKRLVDKGSSFVLISDNKDYEDQTINKEDVLCVYRVIGSLKMSMF